MSRGTRKEALPLPARSLRCPGPPCGAGRGGDFAQGPGKFGALRALVQTLGGKRRSESSLRLTPNKQHSDYALGNFAGRSYIGSGHLRVGPDSFDELLQG